MYTIYYYWFTHRASFQTHFSKKCSSTYIAFQRTKACRHIFLHIFRPMLFLFLFKLAAKSQIIRMDPLVANINEDENVDVSCFATGIPTPTYSWRFRGNYPRKPTTTQIPKPWFPVLEPPKKGALVVPHSQISNLSSVNRLNQNGVWERKSCNLTEWNAIKWWYMKMLFSF